MIYEYRCSSCKKSFDVVKPYARMNDPEHCGCGLQATHITIPERVYFNGTKVEHPEYNPGLGCVVNNKNHRSEICKQRGVEEVGNESVKSLHKHFDDRRLDKIEQAYEKSTDGWVGDGT